MRNFVLSFACLVAAVGPGCALPEFWTASVDAEEAAFRAGQEEAFEAIELERLEAQELQDQTALALAETEEERDVAQAQLLATQEKLAIQSKAHLESVYKKGAADGAAQAAKGDLDGEGALIVRGAAAAGGAPSGAIAQGVFTLLSVGATALASIRASRPA